MDFPVTEATNYPQISKKGAAMIAQQAIAEPTMMAKRVGADQRWSAAGGSKVTEWVARRPAAGTSTTAGNLAAAIGTAADS